MRILFWSGTFWPSIGGVEVLAGKLLPALRERGYEFFVVAPKIPSTLSDEAEYKGIPIHRFSFRNDSTPSIIDYVIKIREKVLKIKHGFAPDLVHINAVHSGNFFHLATNGAYRLPLLVTLHGQWESQIEPIVTHTLRQANWVTGCSAAILDRGRQLVPEITGKSSVIYNGLESPSLEFQPISFSPPRLLCLGRLASDKGFDLALTAFRSIVERFPNARLVIAGDGPARSELERQVASQGLRPVVDFLGWVAPQDVPQVINDSTVVLMPSRAESLPLVALETALMARPVVATRVGGLPEVVKDRQSGLLVEPNDSVELAEATKYLLANPEVAIAMGLAARHCAQKEFSWNAHIDAYDALYQRLGNACSNAALRLPTGGSRR